MFNNKGITINKVKTILNAVRNEFENEIDTIDDIFDREITDEELNFALEFLGKYIDKVELIIDDELKNNCVKDNINLSKIYKGTWQEIGDENFYLGLDIDCNYNEIPLEIREYLKNKNNWTDFARENFDNNDKNFIVLNVWYNIKNDNYDMAFIYKDDETLDEICEYFIKAEEMTDENIDFIKNNLKLGKRDE